MVAGADLVVDAVLGPHHALAALELLGVLGTHAALARDKGESAILIERAKAEAASVVEPFLVAATQADDDTLEPLSLREKIRVSGLTFDAIAAEAMRYA